MPDDITLELPYDTEMSFRFGLTFPIVSVLRTEAAVQQTVQALVKLSGPTPDRILLVSCIQAMQLPNSRIGSGCVRTVNDRLFELRRPQRKRTIEYRSKFTANSLPGLKPIIRWHDALFRYPHVASELYNMMGKWFGRIRTSNLYFASRTQPSQFLAKILWLTQEESHDTLARRPLSVEASQLDNMMGKWFENYEIFEPAFNLYFASRTQPSQFLDTKTSLAYSST